MSKEEQMAPAEPFTVNDDDSANWVIRKIVQARQYAAHVREWAEKEQARAKREEDFFLTTYGPQLKEWARQKLATEGGRRRSVRLPAGTVGFRQQRSQVVVDDEARVLAWAKQHHPELVTLVERLSKKRLNELAEQTGELPNDGVHVEPTADRFYVK